MNKFEIGDRVYTLRAYGGRKTVDAIRYTNGQPQYLICNWWYDEKEVCKTYSEAIGEGIRENNLKVKGE